jgi:hypothetical protein
MIYCLDLVSFYFFIFTSLLLLFLSPFHLRFVVLLARKVATELKFELQSNKLLLQSFSDNSRHSQLSIIHFKSNKTPCRCKIRSGFNDKILIRSSNTQTSFSSFFRNIQIFVREKRLIDIKFSVDDEESNHRKKLFVCIENCGWDDTR